MALDVGFHLLLALERLVTNGAFVALRTVVLHPVQLQHVVVAEVPEANITMVRFLTGVSARVHLQLFRAREALAAAFNRTFVRFLTGMGPHVDD